MVTSNNLLHIPAEALIDRVLWVSSNVISSGTDRLFLHPSRKVQKAVRLQYTE